MLPQITKHAKYRAAQSDIKNDEIETVLRFGRTINKGHALFCFLGRKDLPEELHRDDYFNKLVGTTIVMDFSGQEILTVYKNKKAIKNIKHKN